MNKSRDAVALMPSASYAGCRAACTVAANLLCSARIQGNANFGLWLSFSPRLHTSACHSGRCARCFPALLASTRGSELMSPSGDCCGAPVMVSVSCSPVWRSSPGLCILLSAPIQQSAPPPPTPTLHTQQTFSKAGKLALWATRTAFSLAALASLHKPPVTWARLHTGGGRPRKMPEKL